MFTWNAATAAFTPIDGIYHITYSLRVEGLTDGTYFGIVIESETDTTLAADYVNWTVDTQVNEASLLITRVVSSADTNDVSSIFKFDTDATLTNVDVSTLATSIYAIKIAEVPAPVIPPSTG